MIDTTLITLRDFWEHTARSRILKEFTESYQLFLDNIMQNILQRLGSTRMADLTTDILEEYFYSIRHEAVAYRQHRKALLNHICNEAVKKRIIRRNPVQKMKVIRTPYNPVYGLSDDAMQALINYKDSSILCDLLKTQLYSGLSLAELVALTIENVDRDSGMISIQQFFKRSSQDNWIISQTFRSKKPRTIQIPSHAMQHILHAMDQNNDSCVDNRFPDEQKPTGYIFAADNNVLFSYTVVRHYYKKVAHAAGIDHLSPRLLEANFGLRAARLKLNPKDLHIYLGYKTCSTVARYYDFSGYEHKPATFATEQYYNRILEEEQ